MRQSLVRFMQICETATRAKFSQIMRTFLLRQVHVYNKPTKIMSLPECAMYLLTKASISLFSPLSFDLHLHPSSFHFDVNFEKASFVALVEKNMTLEQIDLGSKIIINDTRKEDVLQCRLYYLMVYPKAL